MICQRGSGVKVFREIQHKGENMDEFDSLKGMEQIRAAFNRLRDNCIYYDAIIENYIDGIFITDGQGKVIKINRAYELISGTDREEWLGLNILELERRQIISQSITLVALKKKAPVTMDQVLFRTNRRALVSCQPLFDEQGQVTMVVSCVRDITELESLRERVMEEKERAERYEKTLEILKEQLASRNDLVAKDEKTIALVHKAQKLAKLDTTILLLGETGSGKDEFAKFIHESSPRRHEHFIKVNCGAIMGSLIESELFGYEKGAFSGAHPGGKSGLFEVANKGTIYLDEIAEMPLDMQVKLLRVIQEKEFTKVGGVKPVAVDVKIIAATNRNLKEMVAKQEFREDLYYRLSIVPLVIPPLRERRADIVPLVHAFIEKYNAHYGLNLRFSTGALQKLAAHTWRGNVRELRNAIEKFMILSNSPIITAEDIIFENGPESRNLALGRENDLRSMLEQYESQFILKAYQQGGSVSAGAALLNMKRSTFAAKLKKINDAAKAKAEN